MKKKISLFLAAILATATLASCTNVNTNSQNLGFKTYGYKTGIAISSSASSSKDATTEDGVAQVDTMIAGVIVDKKGKIVDCVIDSVQTVTNFGADGKIKSDLNAEIKSKNELGEEYGMIKASKIKKEWNEQADAFAKYCIGKTAEEVAGIAVTEEGKAADEDLTASVTVHIGGFQSIVVQAVNKAVEMGAKKDDKLGLGIISNMGDSKDATAEENGLVQANTTASVTTINKDGEITSTYIDSIQSDIKFDTTGKIQSDINAPIESKSKLGEKYGMKKASSIKKEWNQQVAAYAQYCIGKTVEEVNNTAVKEGVPSDEDLAASVTIHISEFNNVITKAVDNAK